MTWTTMLARRWRRWWSSGSQGERLAVKFLKKQGYRILGTNLRAGRFEVDILAQTGDRQCLVIVEVKTSISTSSGPPPELRVNRDKQRMTLLAASYLIKRYKLPESRIRFDVLAVELSAGGKPVIRHIPGAFGQA